jgi:hypothetical protein
MEVGNRRLCQVVLLRDFSPITACVLAQDRAQEVKLAGVYRLVVPLPVSRVLGAGRRQAMQANG